MNPPKRKCLFIVLEWMDRNKGIARKALGQYKALSKIFDVEFYFLKLNSRNWSLRILYRYFYSQLWIARQIIINPGTIIFYRYSPAYPLINWLIFFLHRRNPIFVEVNTKHIDEFKNNLIFNLLNKLSEKAVYRGATCALTITPELADYVHAIEPKCDTRVMGNGYDPPDLPVSQGISVKSDLPGFIARAGDRRKFIWVGEIAPWHGLDKIVAIINQLEDACLYLVGDINKAHQIGINASDKVFLLGRRNYQELQYLYAHCDFALGCFALELKNMSEAAPLKVREYFFHGLPVIFTNLDPQLQNQPFVHRYEDNKKLLYFLQKKFDRKEIKQYAREHLTWQVILEDIFAPETTICRSSPHQGQARTGITCT